MKLSAETLTVLKNFSTINSGIYFKEGNVLTTMSPSKTILAKTIIDQEFPQGFGIYDLNNLLSLISVDKENTELEFDAAHVILSNFNGRSKIHYRFTDKAMIVTPPDKEINFGTPDVSFTLTTDDLQWIMKISNLLQSPNVSVVGENGELKIVTFDIKNDAAHQNSLVIGETDKEFRFVFKTENLKILLDTYNIDISSKGISKWTNEKNTTTYWITTEQVGNYYKG